MQGEVEMVKIGKRILYIDILKAIACICVLLGHVVGGIMKAGISVSQGLYDLHTFVFLFHVPCFFFASGYLYANHPVRDWKEYSILVLKKMLALGFPYVVCTVFYVGLSSFVSNEMNPNTSYTFNVLYSIWKQPIALYWYLYALLGLFMFIPGIELIFKRVNKKILWIGFVVLMCMDDFGVPCIYYILQYSYLFYMGVIWHESDNRENKWVFRHDEPIWCGIYCMESIIIFCIYTIVANGNILSDGAAILWENMIIVLLVFTMVRISYVVAENESRMRSFLLWVAGYSFYIYLFHTWFSGTVRVVLRKIGITTAWVQVPVGCVCGLLGPVLLAKIIRKTGIMKFWIEPLAVLKRKGA